MSRKRLLVVASRTTDSPDLIEVLRQREAAGGAEITLLVPAVPHGLAWATDMTAGAHDASLRAMRGARRMRDAGLAVEEVLVGDPDPLAAAADALHATRYDEVIVLAPRRRVSRWLHLSLPDRLRRAVSAPVTQLQSSGPPPSSEPPPALSSAPPDGAAGAVVAGGAGAGGSLGAAVVGSGSGVDR